MKYIIAGIIINLFLTEPILCQEKYFENFPQGSTPLEIGEKLSGRFLESDPMLYNNKYVHYAEVCTWLGALRYARAAKNDTLVESLTARFDPFFSTKSNTLPPMNHVDFNMFGSLPLELYRITGKKRYYELGIPYANTQWENPDSLTAKEERWIDKGYTWQTRLWIDDMYMITIVQKQAFSITGNRDYIDRAARQMVMYLDSLQRPNGLFFHAPDVPYYWSRGNGWMAAGMAELLEVLPEDSRYRPRILKGYRLMMQCLKDYQGENGLWNQLINEEDFWPETSGTAMFTYAMIVGVKNGWLNEELYGPVARKAWMGLIPFINEDGDVTEVCMGTGKKNDKQYYYDRPRITGDFHGQAPVLWCAHVLLENSPEMTDNVRPLSKFDVITIDTSNSGYATFYSYGMIETMLVDAEADFYGTFQSHNQKVVSTPDGIFMTYSRNRIPVPGKPESEDARWRLVRSTDGGKTFQTILEAVHGTRAPALESDEAGNLYMTHPDWNDPCKPFLFYRFGFGGDYSKPMITTIPNIPCGAKYAMAYDPVRKHFYIAAQYGQLLTVSPGGEVLQRGMGFGRKGPHAGTQYPHLVVSPDGVLHHAMTTVGQQKSGKEGYWDIHYMNSPDGGLTWRKLDGTILPAEPVPDDTGPTDRISLDDEFDLKSWLANMLVKDGKVHFIYEGKTMHYLRYDLATGKKDVVLDGKQFGGKNLALSHGSGLLVSREDNASSPLFCVSRDPQRRTLACLVSYNNGLNWSDHAMANREFLDNYAVGGAREITNDGYIIGSFTARIRRGGFCKGVWFYRIRTNLNRIECEESGGIVLQNNDADMAREVIQPGNCVTPDAID